jgi:hypothetical protein
MTGGGALGAAEGGGTAGNAVTLSGAATCAGSTFLGAWRTTGSSGALAGLSPPAVLAEADLAPGAGDGVGSLFAPAVVAGGSLDWIGSFFASTVVAGGSLR